MNDVVGSVRQVIQDFLAPELRQHRAELVSIRGELVSVRSELTTKIEAAERRLDSKIEALRSEFHAMQVEMRSGFSALGAALENAVLRGQLSTTREISDLRIRVEGLEKERGQMPQ
jgi:hypothetical protein